MNICPPCKANMKYQWLALHFDKGLPITHVATLAGFHQDTLYLWKRKYLQGGISALEDESKAPHKQAKEYPDDVKEKIRLLRTQALEKEHRYLGPNVIRDRLRKRYSIIASHSGIGKFLNREGLIPEKRKRRRPKKERVKKCKIHEPGELLQMDVKYAVKSYAGYWFYQYDAIDYVTGVVFGDIYPIQSNYESVRFLNVVVKRSPFAVGGVQTDNHSTFTNYYTGYKKSMDPSNPRFHAFDLSCAAFGLIHYLTDPGKPAQNGKIERFHKTAEEEFYQHETFKDLNALKRKFRDYLHYYNHEREHSTNGYLTPLQKLQTFPKYEKVKEIIN